MKTCFKCFKSLPFTEFYKHPAMGDGYLGKCKDCTKADTKARAEEKSKDPKWIISERKRGREKYHRLGYKDIHKTPSDRASRAAKAFRNAYPEKKAAYHAVCKIKVKEGHNNHHWSYSQEHFLDTIELTIADHAKAHRYLSYDQSIKRYRTMHGTDLSTKRKHLRYIKAAIGLPD